MNYGCPKVSLSALVVLHIFLILILHRLHPLLKLLHLIVEGFLLIEFLQLLPYFVESSLVLLGDLSSLQAFLQTFDLFARLFNLRLYITNKVPWFSSSSSFLIKSLLEERRAVRYLKLMNSSDWISSRSSSLLILGGFSGD